MAEIRLLDTSVINLIAAGEVVDRPASVVKEMVENAIDAGAKHITVEIRRGGLGMIRILDDGCGMSAENARRSFLKHATSKITTEDDLNRISTLGFRGEALAAISAVSRIVLTTKVPGTVSGTRLEVSEGAILREEEYGCPDGSCFTVEDLFFNTPARLKFMKSEPAEAGAVQSVMERLALSHPQISFRFVVNGLERLHTPGKGNLIETAFSVFGKEFAEMSLPADLSTGAVRVWGIVGKPVYSKANRSRQIFFLNGRYVRSGILTAGFESAYHNKMLIGRVPTCVLFLEMPTEQVDVNVHPSKLEVKFADENAVSYAVRKATEHALSSDSGIVEMRVKPPLVQPIPPTPAPNPPVKERPSGEGSFPAPQPKPVSVANDRQKKPEDIPVKRTVSQIPDQPKTERSGWTITPPPAPEKPFPKVVLNDVVPVMRPKAEVKTPPPSIVEKPVPPLRERSVPEKPTVPPVNQPTVPPVNQPTEEPVLFHVEESVRLIGEAFDCFVLVERGEDLLFVDKHALHERMNFERLRKSEIPSQGLLQPIVMHLGIDENRILVENADFLARFGFILESFGDDLLIREIPAIIPAEQAESLLQEFADSLAIGRDDTLMDKFYYDLACKASIRSGSKTSRQELEQLIGEYFRREKELQYCPHGRPIVFSLSKKSIEKQFKRLK